MMYKIRGSESATPPPPGQTPLLFLLLGTYARPRPREWAGLQKYAHIPQFPAKL